MNFFFDFDGTLIDSKNRLYSLFCYLNPQIDISFERYWDYKKSKISHKEILLEIMNYSNTQFLEFEKNWMNNIETDQWLSLDKPIEGVHNLLTKLSNSHTLYLVTARQSKSQVIKQLNEFEMTSFFDQILVTKQKIDKFNLILNCTNVNPYDFIVGDTGKDIQTGKQLGIRTVAVLSGFLSIKSLIEYSPDYILNDATMLLNSDFFELK